MDLNRHKVYIKSNKPKIKKRSIYYEYYALKNKKLKSKCFSKNDFEAVLTIFFEEVKKELLEKGELELPNIGRFDIVSNKITRDNKKIDWKKTIKLKKKIYYTNLHSNYTFYRTKWKPTSRKHLKYLRFKSSKPFRKEISEVVFSGKMLYSTYNSYIDDIINKALKKYDTAYK